MATIKKMAWIILAAAVILDVSLADDAASSNKTNQEDDAQKKPSTETNKETPNKNAPQDPAIAKSASDAAPAPAVPKSTTAAPIVPTDLICRSCDCQNTTIDCKDKGLDKMFSEADWAGVTKMGPKLVDLSTNSYDKITSFFKLPIQTLILSSCGISSIDTGSFRLLQDMEVLDLSHNKLTSAALNPHVFQGVFSPEEYEPLSSLKVLNLADNDIHSLQQDIFEHVPDLEELTLAGNSFPVIDHVTVVAITSLPKLKVLDMSRCKIKDLPDTFLYTPRHLERLDLSDNSLEFVPQELKYAKTLTYLNLSKNPIRYIVAGDEMYKSFPPIPNLKELHLSDMPDLEEIRNHAMGDLQNLEVLYITNNLALSYLEPMMLARKFPEGEGWAYPMLKELHLRSNNLTTIANGLVGRWDKLTVIDIRFNPFLCDCTNQWMVDTLVPMLLETSPNRTMDIICREPVEMRGKSIVHLEEVHRHMRCLDRYGRRPEKDGALLVGTVIGVLLAVPICLGILLMYKRGYFSICGISAPGEFSRAFYKRANTADFSF